MKTSPPFLSLSLSFRPIACHGKREGKSSAHPSSNVGSDWLVPIPASRAVKRRDRILNEEKLDDTQQSPVERVVIDRQPTATAVAATACSSRPKNYSTVESQHSLQTFWVFILIDLYSISFLFFKISRTLNKKPSKKKMKRSLKRNKTKNKYRNEIALTLTWP